MYKVEILEACGWRDCYTSRSFRMAEGVSKWRLFGSSFVGFDSESLTVVRRRWWEDEDPNGEKAGRAWLSSVHRDCSTLNLPPATRICPGL
jgi:hypothetical protein